jgi:hypothetical protein
MSAIDITAEERELLGQVLKNYLAALDVEIVHTDNAEFKRMLKQRRDALYKLAARLEQPVAAGR